MYILVEFHIEAKQKQTNKTSPMENSNVDDQKQIWITLWVKFYTKLHM